MINLITILATISGIMLGVANIPQAFKIYRRKSAKDISVVTYALLLIGSIIWTIYGFYLNTLPLIIGNGIASIVALAVIVGWIKYR